MKKTYWFKHDFNARNDKKHVALRREFDVKGYGLYWVIIESLCEEDNYKLPINNVTYESISTEANVDIDFVKNYINKAIEVNLFATDNNYIWSVSLNNRMNALEKAHELKVKAGVLGAKSRWGKHETKEKPVKKETKKIEEDSIEMTMVNYLIEKIVEISPNARLPKTDQAKQNWASTFDKMFRLDKRTPKDTYRIIDYSFNDSFWRANILSPDSLRKHFDKLELQSRGKKYSNKNKPTAHKVLD